MCARKIIASEVVNNQVDQAKPWSSEMKQSKIWTKTSQDRLALQLKVESTKGKNIREVQKGDTLGAIVKGLKGTLDWNQTVDYKSLKLDSNQKPKILSDANLIYPGQYVWIESERIVVSDTEPLNSANAEVKKKLEKKTKLVPPKTKVPTVKKKPKKEPKKKLADRPTVDLIPGFEDLKIRSNSEVLSTTKRPLHPISSQKHINNRLNSLKTEDNEPIPTGFSSGVLGILKELNFNRDVDFSKAAQKTNRRGFVGEIIKATKDGYFDLSVITPEENRIANMEHIKNARLGVHFGEISVQELGGQKGVYINKVLSDSEAERAGIKSGEIVMKINNGPANLKSFFHGLRKAEDRVELEIYSPFTRTSRTKTVPLKGKSRKETFVNKITGLENTFHAKTIAFTPLMVEDMKDQLANQEATNLVVDLRGNPGGYLDETEEMSRYLSSLANLGVKIYLLTNKNSASASEFLAVKAQRNNWGIVVGEKTFGKHVQQVTKEIGGDENGNNYVLKYTEGKSSEGNFIPVTPNVEVEGSKALEVVKAIIKKESSVS